MANSTTNFKFRVPVEGGDENNWGEYLNDNLVALEAIFSGTTSTSVSPSDNINNATLITGSATSIKPNLTASQWKIGGVAVTATAAELNLLDGVTATTSELNILDGVTATAAEINILDGVTATTAELNILDGVTATTAEINVLDGITATVSELNILDGVTATFSEINNVVAGKSFLDEDDMASDSATGIPSQQSVKAYVDNNKYDSDDLKTDLNATGSAPIYACRAWVNFNGTDTVAIRASGNVSSITDNGTGDYTVNFSTAMPDANYATVATAVMRQESSTSNYAVGYTSTNNAEPLTYTASAVRIINKRSVADAVDTSHVSVAIFR